MTRDKFVEHCRKQFAAIRDIDRAYEGKKFDAGWLRAMAHDFRLVAQNIEELCDVHEMENKVK